MDCIFCKIIAGDIPSIKVFEDGNTVAFMDINPLSEGHLLVVPKKHFTSLFDADDDSLAQTFSVVRKLAVALQKALGIDSLNLLQANGRWAAQSVPHFHFHVIPRRENDGVPLDPELKPGNVEQVRKTGEAISTALS
ncbi:MAG: HIT family protein [SAR324 cluster bacterium]|nr:HIT family protein [SAR324 cluster bacterium]